MNFDLWLALAVKLLELFQQVDFNAPADPEVSREIKAATDLAGVHAAVAKLRKKVTK